MDTWCEKTNFSLSKVEKQIVKTMALWEGSRVIMKIQADYVLVYG